MSKISSLSFDLEKTTRAANMLVKGCILFIATFILFVPIVLIALITSILGYMHIYTIQVLSFLMFLIIFFMVISAILMVKIIPPLMSAYEIKENMITHGFLRAVPRYVEKNNAKVNAATNAALLATLKAGDNFTESYRTYKAIKGSSNIYKLIRQNADPYFVEEFFHTECFNKKIYYNPVLVKTTKHAYIYKCDNKKRLVIRKLYSNMDTVGTHKPRSLKGRIILPVLLLVLLTSVLTVGTIYANMEGTNYYNYVIMPQIEAQLETLIKPFEGMGYELDTFEKNSNTGFYEIKFRHHGNKGKEDSVVSYRFDYDGKIQLDNIYLYVYDYEFDGAHELKNELNLLLNIHSGTFSEDKIDKILLSIQDAIDGKVKMDLVYSDNNDYGIIIKPFESYVFLYNH